MFARPFYQTAVFRLGSPPPEAHRTNRVTFSINVECTPTGIVVPVTESPRMLRTVVANPEATRDDILAIIS